MIVKSDQSMALLKQLVECGVLGPDTAENRASLAQSIIAVPLDSCGTMGLRELAGILRRHSDDAEVTANLIFEFGKAHHARWCIALGNLVWSPQ